MVHNLGKFDGLFKIKGLTLAVNYKIIETLVDKNKSFIIMSAPLKNVNLVFRDS